MGELRAIKEVIYGKPTLGEILSVLDISVLNEIVYNVRFKKFKGAGKKEIVDLLIQTLPGAVREIIKKFDIERYELIKRIIENKGILYNCNINDSKKHALTLTGLVYPIVIDCERALFMPDEIFNSLGDIDNIDIVRAIQNNTKFINNIHGILCYHGYMDLDDIFQHTLKRKAAESLENLSYLETLRMAVFYYDWIEVDGMGFRYEEVEDCLI